MHTIKFYLKRRFVRSVIRSSAAASFVVSYNKPASPITIYHRGGRLLLLFFINIINNYRENSSGLALYGITAGRPTSRFVNRLQSMRVQIPSINRGCTDLIRHHIVECQRLCLIRSRSIGGIRYHTAIYRGMAEPKSSEITT